MRDSSVDRRPEAPDHKHFDTIPFQLVHRVIDSNNTNMRTATARLFITGQIAILMPSVLVNTLICSVVCADQQPFAQVTSSEGVLWTFIEEGPFLHRNMKGVNAGDRWELYQVNRPDDQDRWSLRALKINGHSWTICDVTVNAKQVHVNICGENQPEITAVGTLIRPLSHMSLGSAWTAPDRRSTCYR